ncbi:MAG: type II secretion system protein [Phycisphaeraceae bacterium]|nr:type II secretion system protein [Phycisphaeraceae bacterium]
MRRVGLRSRAFTLVEILVALAIMGIATAIVIPSMMSAGQMGVQAAARMVIADLLVAQNDAVAAQRSRRVVFEPGFNRYRLTDAAGINLQRSWKGHGGHGSSYIVDFTLDSRFRGVRLVEAEFGDDSFVEFDDLGTPDKGGHVILESEGGRFRVRVANLTGRVTVERVTLEPVVPAVIDPDDPGGL